MNTSTTHFPVYTEATAPESARQSLINAKQKYGFVPNLLGKLAHAPALLQGYLSLSQAFEQSSFSEIERQVILLVTSLQNKCSYCAAAHAAIAKSYQTPDEVIEAIRNNEPVTDVKLEALRVFTQAVVESRAWLLPEDIQEFLSVGYTEQHMLEVILGVGVKTLSNYANHVMSTPLDEAFESSHSQAA